MPFINNESKHMEQVTLLLSKKVLSTFGRNDLYIQLVGQLSYTDGKFTSDGKFIMKKVPTIHFPLFQRREKSGRITGNYYHLLKKPLWSHYLGDGGAHMSISFDVQLLKHPTSNLSHQEFPQHGVFSSLAFS